MKDRARVCAHTATSTFIDLNSLWGHQLYVSVMKQEGSQASSNSKVRKGSRAINNLARCRQSAVAEGVGGGGSMGHWIYLCALWKCHTEGDIQAGF